MPITDIVLSGKIYQDDGDAVNGATVALLETGTSTQEASTTSDSNGAWSFTETSLDATYDIKITSGTSVRYILWSDEITTKGVDTASLKVRGVEGAAAPIYFFADQADDAGDGWRIQASASDTLAIGSDKAVAGTIIDYLTITNGANAAASTVTVGGILTVTTTLDINGTADFDVTDFDIASSGDIDLVSTNDAAAAIYLRENAGTSGTVKIHADQGTSVTEGAESINILSDAGGVGIRSTANLAKAVNITSDGGTTGSISIFNDQGTSVTEGAESISLLSDAGGVGIRSTANLANAVNLTVDGGTSSTMTLFNDQGTAATEGAASIQLLSDVGGINVKSGLNAASAILLTADGGTSETIVVHADQGTGTGSIELLSDAGGIEIDAGTDIILDAGGADIFLKDDGTLFGTLTNSSGELVIKSSSSGTTAATFSGANVTLAGTVGSGAITSSGIIKTDDTTEATSTTDGSLQTDGGLSVAKDAVFGDDVFLLSDSAVLNLGAGNDATLTHDGTTGLTIAANPIIVDSGAQIELDSASGIITFEDGGTEVLRFTEGNSGDVTVKLVTNGKDLIFTDNGDATNMKILDAAAGINVPGEVQTTGIGYTDGDNAMTIADGGGVTFPVSIDITGSAGIILENDETITNSTNGYIALSGGLTLPNDGTIGSAGDADSIAISSAGVVTMDQIPVFSAGINVSGGTIAGTLATAAQGNITSLGTLTALTVDDVAINGKVVTMTGSSSDTAVFTAGTNGTLSIVTTDAAAAAANIQITADGTAELAGTTVTLDSGGDIELEATNDINIPTDKGLTFGDDGQKIESDGTDFTIASGAQLNLTATGNVSFGDGDITNVGTIDLDQIDPDGNTIGIGSAPSASGYFRIGATSAPASSTDYYQSIVGGRVNPVSGRRSGLFYVAGTIGTSSDSNDEHPLIAAVNIGAPTIVTGGEDIGILATLYVANAPIDSVTQSYVLNSGEVTGGGPHALWVDAGTSRFDGGVIIGASESTNNLIDDASTGSGSTTLYVGNQSITTSSDARLKENITDSTVNALDKIKELRVVDFDWVDPSDTSPNNKNARGRWTGMLAQETVETVPWIINAPRTEDGEIDHASSNTWFVDYQHLVPMLVKAIQQLEAKL